MGDSVDGTSAVDAQPVTQSSKVGERAKSFVNRQLPTVGGVDGIRHCIRVRNI